MIVNTAKSYPRGSRLVAMGTRARGIAVAAGWPLIGTEQDDPVSVLKAEAYRLQYVERMQAEAAAHPSSRARISREAYETVQIVYTAYWFPPARKG